MHNVWNMIGKVHYELESAHLIPAHLLHSSTQCLTFSFHTKILYEPGYGTIQLVLYLDDFSYQYGRYFEYTQNVRMYSECALVKSKTRQGESLYTY